jgi:hypothetical protein
MSRMSECSQARWEQDQEIYTEAGLPASMSPLEIAIFQLRAAHRDIEISAYNAAKFRIEIAIAGLRGLVGGPAK